MTRREKMIAYYTECAKYWQPKPIKVGGGPVVSVQEQWDRAMELIDRNYPLDAPDGWTADYFWRGKR